MFFSFVDFYCFLEWLVDGVFSPVNRCGLPEKECDG